MERILKNKKLLSFSILIILFLIVVYTSLPFLTAFFGGLVMFILLLPVKKILQKKYSNYPSSWVCVVISLAIIIVPVILFILILGDRIVSIREELMSSSLSGQNINNIIPFIDANLSWREFATNTIPYLVDPLESIFSNIIHISIILFIMHAVLFYLLLNEKQFIRGLKKALPFNKKNNENIIRRFYDLTYAAILGNIIIAIVQGGLMTVAFLLTGLPGAFFWGFITAILSLIPILGSPIIWGPAMLYLFFVEAPIKAVVMLIFGIIITLSDNIIRPVINKRFGSVHPLITIIGVFAGIYQFGFIGIFIGPLLIAYLVLVWKIYKEEYLKK